MGISMQTASRHQAMRKRVGGRGGSGRKVEFDEDIADVASDGLFADAEIAGNRPVRLSTSDQTQHFHFT